MRDDIQCIRIRRRRVGQAETRTWVGWGEAGGLIYDISLVTGRLPEKERNKSCSTPPLHKLPAAFGFPSNGCLMSATVRPVPGFVGFSGCCPLLCLFCSFLFLMPLVFCLPLVVVPFFGPGFPLPGNAPLFSDPEPVCRVKYPSFTPPFMKK